ncbi:MAG: hypothetical protein HY077_02900 [Elusimicrobia bacterium]|nr:hypothetical protein [Elusimicrobiota bacterium]
MADLKKLPEFKALEAVYAALLPLKPEGRRKVIEAIHTLIEISPGEPGRPARRR